MISLCNTNITVTTISPSRSRITGTETGYIMQLLGQQERYATKKILAPNNISASES